MNLQVRAKPERTQTRRRGESRITRQTRRRGGMLKMFGLKKNKKNWKPTPTQQAKFKAYQNKLSIETAQLVNDTYAKFMKNNPAPTHNPLLRNHPVPKHTPKI